MARFQNNMSTEGPADKDGVVNTNLMRGRNKESRVAAKRILLHWISRIVGAAVTRKIDGDEPELRTERACELASERPA